MSDVVSLTLSWVAGVGLGTMFFGGLWWTIRKALASERPAVWFACSALVRLSLTLTGFYFVSGGHWKPLLLCLLGFVLARAGVTWLTRSSDGDDHSTHEHSTHEARRAS